MIPKTLILRYPEHFEVVAPGSFLPKLLHTRPSAATLVSYKREPGKLPVAVISSAYDALNDIVVEAEIVGNEALVLDVKFKESA